MPNYTNATDASARTLDIYKKTKEKQNVYKMYEPCMKNAWNMWYIFFIFNVFDMDNL